jgi:N-ethylmaleimide reductase
VTSIFDAYQLGPTAMRNRIVMAPMTRSRAMSHAPDADTALYYRQRAGAGLIVTEGTPISREGRGYAYTPGIYSDDQVSGWRRVVDGVHAEGGTIFAQLWHVGRQSHVSLQADQAPPVSSMNVRADVDVWGFDANGTACGVAASQPRALETDEITRVTQNFVTAADNAMRAGFDGVELHGANGYLFEQFINGALNQRTDHYGGSIENRLRFALETLDAVCAKVGGAITGIRLAPFGRFGDMAGYDDEKETWLAMAQAMSERDIAYVHVSDQETLGAEAIPNGFVDEFRAIYKGVLIVAGGFDDQKADTTLAADRADLIAIGRPFISNPDLIERYRQNWPVVEPDRDTFYTGGRTGYTDYPPYGSGD